MATWLGHSFPDRVVWVSALAGDIALCSYSHSVSVHPGV